MPYPFDFSLTDIPIYTMNLFGETTRVTTPISPQMEEALLDELEKSFALTLIVPLGVLLYPNGTFLLQELHSEELLNELNLEDL